jgi:Lrp/AsnC family transcriptional regulator for asnA, asnC and gidA
MTEAYVHVVVDAGAAMKAADRIASLDAVEQTHVVTGEYDVIAHVSLEHEEDLPEVVAEQIHGAPGVADTVTSVAFPV